MDALRLASYPEMKSLEAMSKSGLLCRHVADETQEVGLGVLVPPVYAVDWPLLDWVDGWGVGPEAHDPAEQDLVVLAGVGWAAVAEEEDYASHVLR
ncbi:hypothetical protein PR202_ga19846 [Eleusine coracana subsp. coracana]|uniref:Uncharacterized protein n=1 Tax=Eleusine coracana subsp. coracana TaxID=191504 RepID=A0AAV5CVB1_ELECO|nr:hypothetical protein PR202_ga19846 [Eleusine coracana subsp. coracana]